MPLQAQTCGLCGEAKSKVAVHICDKTEMVQWRTWVAEQFDSWLRFYTTSRLCARDRYHVEVPPELTPSPDLVIEGD